jgi:adenine-specific DNA-methyltransferase
MERIVGFGSNPGDLVVDFFAGSGTTGAVAHKMRRRWILIEQGSHIETHILSRLKAVIDGTDPGGITPLTGWTGGGVRERSTNHYCGAKKDNGS